MQQDDILARMRAAGPTLDQQFSAGTIASQQIAAACYAHARRLAEFSRTCRGDRTDRVLAHIYACQAQERAARAAAAARNSHAWQLGIPPGADRPPT